MERLLLGDWGVQKWHLLEWFLLAVAVRGLWGPGRQPADPHTSSQRMAEGLRTQDRQTDPPLLVLGLHWRKRVSYPPGLQPLLSCQLPFRGNSCAISHDFPPPLHLLSLRWSWLAFKTTVISIIHKERSQTQITRRINALDSYNQFLSKYT